MSKTRKTYFHDPKTQVTIERYDTVHANTQRIKVCVDNDEMYLSVPQARKLAVQLTAIAEWPEPSEEKTCAQIRGTLALLEQTRRRKYEALRDSQEHSQIIKKEAEIADLDKRIGELKALLKEKS